MMQLPLYAENQMKNSIDKDSIDQKSGHCEVEDASINSRTHSWAFIRRVSCLLTMQLVFASIIVSSVLFTPLLRFYINENGWLLNVGYLLCIISALALMAKRTESPSNCILLVAFTCSGIYTVAVVVTYYDQLAILQAFILVSLSSTILIVYSLFTKKEFSPLYAGFFSCLVILMFSGIFQMVLGSTHIEMVIAAVGSLIFSFYIIHRMCKLLHKLSPNEYVVGVIDLYLGVINSSIVASQSVLPVRK